jgi:hypothetical protein
MHKSKSVQLCFSGICITLFLLGCGGDSNPPKTGHSAKLDTAENRTQTQNQLKRIADAFHDYQQEHHQYPPSGRSYPDSGDGEPKRLLSWRVRILPQLGHRELFDKFQLDEPWDSPANKVLVDQMPDVYRSAFLPEDEPKTLFLGAVLPKAGISEKQFPLFRATVFDQMVSADGRRKPGLGDVKLKDMVDGTKNTILIVEADKDQAVVWTKPDDWELDPAEPLKGLGNLRPGGFHIVTVYGEPRFITNKIDPDELVSLFLLNDGGHWGQPETPQPDDLPPEFEESLR